MNEPVKFWCFIKDLEENWRTFDFEMGDIFSDELNKWLKADAPDAATTFFFLEVLKTVKSLSFYTMSESNARWSPGELRILNDFFQSTRPGRLFDLKIIAMSSNFGTMVECRECQPVRALVAPTPIGKVQSYTLKYKEVLLQKLAVSPGSKSNLGK